MHYIVETDLDVGELTTLTEEGGVVVSASLTIFDEPEREFGVAIETSKYAELWKSINKEYPTTISISLLGNTMLIRTREAVQNKTSDTKAYIMELISNIEGRLAKATDRQEISNLNLRKTMLSGLL